MDQNDPQKLEKLVVDLEKRIVYLEKQNIALKLKLEDMILDRVAWHTHLMNGKVHWNMPPEVVERKIRQAKFKFDKDQQKKKAEFPPKVVGMKEKANMDDSFNFKLEEVSDK